MTKFVMRVENEVGEEYDLVAVHRNDSWVYCDLPSDTSSVGLSPEEARALGRELVRLASEIDGRDG